jgi:hypothetical protein
LSIKISKLGITLSRDKPKSAPPEYNTLLVRLQVSLERLMKMLSVIIESLPDLDQPIIRQKEKKGCTYVRSDSTKEAFKYLIDEPVLPEKQRNQEEKKLCIPALIVCIGVIDKILIRMDILMNKLKLKYSSSRAVKLTTLTSQLEITSDVELQAAFNANNDSVLYKSKDSLEWTQMKPYYAVDVSYCNKVIGE